MPSAIASVTAFATIKGNELIITPYTSHSRTPVQVDIYMRSDMSPVERERHAFRNCGKNATVVRVPAARPSTVIASMD